MHAQLGGDSAHDEKANGLVDYIEQCREQIDTAEKILSGELEEINAERLAELAGVCARPGCRYVAATKLYRRALDVGYGVSMVDRTTWGALAASAATAAVLGKGLDADKLPQEQHAEWLRLARGWLNDELAIMETSDFGAMPLEQLEFAYEVIVESMNTPWYRAICNQDALAGWPAEEQVAWKAIWQRNQRLQARVRPLLDQARERTEN
jgi:hypothetical protein